MPTLAPDYYKYLALIRLAPLERRRGGWRFGTRRIADSVVDRLVDAGRVTIAGDRAYLVELDR